MGITNTISRAELAAIAAAVIHGYSHIATDSLTSLHQIKKQLSHPNLHRHHIQGDDLDGGIVSQVHRVGQNHTYTVYSWRGNHPIYGHIRYISTALANPTGTTVCELPLLVYDHENSPL